jgi:hypothetical protein
VCFNIYAHLLNWFKIPVFRIFLIPSVILFFAGKMVAVRQVELAGKATPSHVVLHPERQGEFVSERTKGFCMKLAVVSWIVSHLPVLSYCSTQ